MIIQARFGAAQTGLGYQFYSATGTLLGTRITAGIVALPETGSYAANATVPTGAAGVFWSSSTTSATEDLRDSLVLAGAEQILLSETYIPRSQTSLIIQTPNPDESLTVAYIYTENIANEKRAGIEISIKLVSTPAKSERVLEIASQKMTTNADGYAQMTVQRGLTYRVVSRALGLDTTMVPTAQTFNLLTLIP